jgi:hypothetical protein
MFAGGAADLHDGHGYSVMQASCDTVEGYPFLRDIKVLFETTWLER